MRKRCDLGVRLKAGFGSSRLPWLCSTAALRHAVVIRYNAGWLTPTKILVPERLSTAHESRIVHLDTYHDTALYPCKLINIHSLVERYMSKCLPILRQPIVRDQYELRGHVIVCTALA
jgi:hypothetical protein